MVTICYELIKVPPTPMGRKFIKSVGEEYQVVKRRDYEGCGEEYIVVKRRGKQYLCSFNIKAVGKNIKLGRGEWGQKV